MSTESEKYNDYRGGSGMESSHPYISELSGWRNPPQSEPGTYNNVYYSSGTGAGYSPFGGDIRDSIAAIWSRTSPSGEVGPFSPYGHFPDNSSASLANGQFAANLTAGHFSDMNIFGALPHGDYSSYGHPYTYGPQYSQWPNSSRNISSYSHGGDEASTELIFGLESVKISGNKKNSESYANAKKLSWAKIASQPPKPLTSSSVSSSGPSKSGKRVGVSSSSCSSPPLPSSSSSLSIHSSNSVSESNNNNLVEKSSSKVGGCRSSGVPVLGNTASSSSHPVLESLKSTNDYNPKVFDVSPKNARYFVIKSFCEDDIHRSIKFEIWCSTEHGNKRLDTAWSERQKRGGPIILLFSVNGSGHFCGMALMLSKVDYSSHNSSVWVQDKFKGQFKVKWIYVKDVPNTALRHIRLENNENKPVTNSRDTQEVPPEKGKMVLKILHEYKHSTSIFDDFVHYEKRQELEVNKKKSVSSPDSDSRIHKVTEFPQSRK